jgi:hypothetical protein
MALQFLYYAGQGPLQYEDTLTYGDMALMEASRAPQHYIENEPTQLYHVVRLSGLTSKIDSAIITGTSTSSSKIDSAVTQMSTANSTTLSTADSMVVSANSYISTVESKLTSHMTP